MEAVIHVKGASSDAAILSPETPGGASSTARPPEVLGERALDTRTFWVRAAATVTSRASSIILGMLSAVVVARALGPEGRGVFAVLMAIGALGVQLANLGLPSAGAYHVARDRQSLPEHLALALWCALVLGTIVGGVFVATAAILPQLAPLPRQSLVIWGAAWIPFGLLVLLSQNILLGLQRVRFYNLLQIAQDVVFLAFITVLVVLGWNTPEHFYGAGLAIVVGSAGIAFAALWNGAGRTLRSPRAVTVRSAAAYGFRAYLATLFAYLVLHLDLLVVARILGEEAAGQYSIAARMAEMAYLPAVALGSILFVTVSSMQTGRWSFTRRVTTRMAALLVPSLLLAAAIAQPLVAFLFGEAFLPAVPAFLWLLPGVFVLSVNTLFMNYFAGTGMPPIAVVSPGIAALANVALNLWLLPLFGIAGAAIASTIAYSAMLVASVAFLVVRRVEN